MQPDKKEKWIADTLNSLQGIQRAERPAASQAKAMQRLQHQRAKIVALSPRQAWRVVACVLVLVTANAFACFHYADPTQQASQGQTLAREYFAFSNPPQL